MTDEISEEEKKKIVVEILEGRKILVGVNELELVEDGERIRPLTDKFKLAPGVDVNYMLHTTAKND